MNFDISQQFEKINVKINKMFSMEQIAKIPKRVTFATNKEDRKGIKLA